MAALAIYNRMAGQWSTDLRSHSPAEDNAHFNAPISPTVEIPQRSRRIRPYPLSTEERQQVPRSPGLGIEIQSTSTTPYSASPSTADEIVFDRPSPSQLSMRSQEEEGSSTSYPIFEPVVEEDQNIENTDWRRHDPPQELLRSQEGTSHDLKSILMPSMERIQARHAEEEERRAAERQKQLDERLQFREDVLLDSSRQRPLARVGRASVKPRRQVSDSKYDPIAVLTGLQVSMTGALNTTHLAPPSTSRLNATSQTSMSSNDSGYGSASPGTEPSRSPRSPARKSFGLRALFKREQRTIVNLKGLDENHLPRPRSSEVWPLPETPLPTPQTRPAPSPESSPG
jgi:hypothetical protein